MARELSQRHASQCGLHFQTFTNIAEPWQRLLTRFRPDNVNVCRQCHGMKSAVLLRVLRTKGCTVERALPIDYLLSRLNPCSRSQEKIYFKLFSCFWEEKSPREDGQGVLNQTSTPHDFVRVFAHI